MGAIRLERIEYLPDAFQETISSLLEIVQKIAEVRKVVIFGSCAKRTQTEKSDVDALLLLQSNEPLRALENKIGLEIYEHLDTTYSRPIDLLFADEKTYEDSSWIGSVYYCAKKDGIVVYE
jgi:predicted nucleotidyltransferase